MDDNGGDDNLQQTMRFTSEDFSELNDIINLTTKTSIEEISELYKSFNSTNNYGGNIENEMPKVESTGLKSLLNEEFPTWQELLDRVRSTALIEGYVTVIKRSKGDRKVVIGYDRGGKICGTSVSLDERKKILATRLSCPFVMVGLKRVGECWKVLIKNAFPNHQPPSDISGHPYCRRFSQEEMLSIRQMTLAGIPPRQILSSLRLSNPKCNAIARTVYNAKATITKEVVAGRTMIQVLVDELGKGNFIFDIERDNGDGHLTHLFFAHPSSIVLTKSYPYVFGNECTYKTNKYKMSLLDIVGVSSFNGSFYSCFAFMQKEEEGDYVWALERFRIILGNDQQPSVILSDRELALKKGRLLYYS